MTSIECFYVMASPISCTSNQAFQMQFLDPMDLSENYVMSRNEFPQTFYVCTMGSEIVTK